MSSSMPICAISRCSNCTGPLPVLVGNWLFRWRNYLFPVTFLGVLFLARPLFPGGSLAADRWMDFAGILVAAAGQTVRGLVIGLAYVTRGGLEGRPRAVSFGSGSQNTGFENSPMLSWVILGVSK